MQDGPKATGDTALEMAHFIQFLREQVRAVIVAGDALELDEARLVPAPASPSAEKVAAREKKERDRKMFDEQAKAYAAQRARQRAAEEAAERVEVDAAKASLLAEERKNARLKKSFQAEQERLAREIIVARKHKEEQKLAEWRENARIDREAREAQDETERRRAMVKAQRDARIAR